MTKEEAYNKKLERFREWYRKNKNKAFELNKKWREEHPDAYKIKEKENRQKGKTKFCLENYELIENYDLAKADNFDRKKWHLHHRLENYWSQKILKKKHLYYSVNPEALIWLPANEHQYDRSLSVKHPELSKWHQRILER